MKDIPVPNDQFTFLIYDIVRGLRHNGQQMLAEVGLTEAQWRAIVHLSRMPGCRQTDLADDLQIRPMSLIAVIDKLEKAGLVERQRVPEDRRAISLHLTKAANPILERLEGIRRQLTDSALCHLSEKERATLIRQLIDIRERLTPHSVQQ